MKKSIVILAAGLAIGFSGGGVLPVSASSSSTRNKIMKNVSPSVRKDDSLSFKVKSSGTTLKVYKIKGFRTWQYSSEYYLAVMRGLQKTDLSKYSQVSVSEDSERYTFDTATFKSLELSNKQIKKLGYYDDSAGEPDYDSFMEEYVQPKALSYKEK